MYDAGEPLPPQVVRRSGVGDRDAPAERGAGRKPEVGLGVHARDEERGDRADADDRLASPGTAREPAQIRRDHPVVALEREQQRDVHVDAAAGQLLDGRDPGGRRGHLDHHVVAVEPPPELERLIDRRIGVVGEVRRALERDEPVGARGAHDVGGSPHVLDAELRPPAVA